MSFYDDASLILLANGEAGKGTDNNGKVYTLKPLEVLGDNITVNGGFETAGTPGDDNYSLGITSPPANNSTNASVVIADGVLTITNGDDGASSDARAYITDGTTTNSIETNEEYRVEYTVVENNGVTGFNIYHQGGQFLAAPGTVGTHVVYTKNTTNKLILFQNTSANSSIVLDDLTVRKVTTQPSDFTMNRGTDLSATVIGKDGLVKKTRQNLVLKSNTFNDSVWGTQGSGTTLTSGSTGYDGTSDAWQLTVSGDSGNVNQALTTTGTKVVSVYAKSVSGSGIRLYGNESGGSNHVSAFFALTGDGSVVGAPNNSITQTITKVGNDGWYRCSVTFDKTLTKFYFYVTTGGAANSTDDTVLIQDAQAEKGVNASDYMHNNSATTAAVVGMKIDDPRFNYDIGGTTPHLLLEPQRVNKIKYSEYFEDSSWLKISSANGSLEHGYEAPDGTMTAYKASNTGTGVSSFGVYTTGNGSIIAGDTRSIWAKTVSGTGTVDLLTYYENTDNLFTVTNEWQRFEITGAIATGAPNLYAVDFRGAGTLNEVLIWGAQAEAGTEATSYIPSYGSATTRTADGLSNLTLPSAITDEDDYTFFVDETASLKMIGNRGPRLTHSDSAKDSNMGYYINSSNKKTFFCWSNGGSSDKPFSDVTSESTDTKYAFHVDNTNERVRCYVDGECIADAAITTDINADKITHSTGEGSLQKLNSILYFPQALSDVDCKVLTGRTNYTAFPEMADKLGYRTYE